jgi:hypothetical protein
VKPTHPGESEAGITKDPKDRNNSCAADEPTKEKVGTRTPNGSSGSSHSQHRTYSSQGRQTPLSSTPVPSPGK